MGPQTGIILAMLALMVVLGLVGYRSWEVRYDLLLNGQEIGLQGDPQVMREIVAQRAAERMNQVVILEHEEQGWRYSLAELGLEIPVDRVLQDLERAVADRRWWQRTVRVDLSLPESWNTMRLDQALAPIRQAVERGPTPASLVVEGDEVRIIPSVDGLSIDAESARRTLTALGQEERLTLPVRRIEPEQSTAVVEGWGIRRLVSEWSTQYDPTIPRAENVERAARAFHGLMLKPGEVLSYNATVGPIDEGSGWKEAMVIVGGELVPGIGGGVCQTATTLYGAALRANLEILERHPHQLAVSYIPPSEDAAVAQGYQDLKIRNATAGRLLIHAEARQGMVTFRLYGDLPAGQSVEIESKVTGSTPYTTRRVEDPSLAAGQEIRSAGVPGVTSEAYRLVFQNGALVKRERLSQDRYLPTPEVVRLGTGQPSH